MSIQYLLVNFTGDRTVLANGLSVGVTNHTLMLPSDEYTITLSGSGYSPASQDAVLTGTSIIKPLILSFTPE